MIEFANEVLEANGKVFNPFTATDEELAEARFSGASFDSREEGIKYLRQRKQEKENEATLDNKK